MTVESIGDWVREFTPTFACWDLLECVHSRRPEDVTAESLGTLVGRSARDIDPALDHLVSRRVLRRRLTPGGAPVYTYDPPPEVAARVQEMLEQMPQKDVRLQVVTAILSENVSSGERPDRGVFSQLRSRTP